MIQYVTNVTIVVIIFVNDNISRKIHNISNIHSVYVHKAGFTRNNKSLQCN